MSAEAGTVTSVRVEDESGEVQGAPVTGVAQQPVQAPVDTTEPNLSVTPDERDPIDRLIGDEDGPIILKSGREVAVKPLKLREFLSLLRILTRGGGSILAENPLNF